MAGRDWTTSELIKLRAMVDFRTTADICEILGRSKSAIYSQMHKHGIRKSKKLTRKHNREQIRSLAMRGYSTTQIAEKLGTTRQTIHYIVTNEMDDLIKARLRGTNQAHQSRAVIKSNKRRASGE